MNRTTTLRAIVMVAAALAIGCDGIITESDSPPEELPPERDEELIGAGGRDLTEFWPSVDIPLSDNVKMLSFRQMRNEVERATGRVWSDWVAFRQVLGGADYDELWADDRTPSQQKLVTWRKMAFVVCDEAVRADAGQSSADRGLFSSIDPAAPIDSAGPAAREQVAAMYQRFFFDSAPAAEVDAALALLADLQAADGGTAESAWSGLCAAYLSSMRFLTY